MIRLLTPPNYTQADKPPVRWPGGESRLGGSELHGVTAAAAPR